MTEIIGISAGRDRKVTESVIRAILEGTGKKNEFISLSGKLIRPCEACNGCVKNNRCVLEDDFQDIIEKCYQTRAIVFGAPNYWDHMNAKGHAFWERTCFSGRHNSIFPLEGKLGIIAAIAGSGNGEPVIKDVETYFKDARMLIVEEISVQGEYACFSCGHGNHCPVGGFVDMYPLGTPIKLEIVPSLANQYPDKPDLPQEERNCLNYARKMGEILSKVLDTRKTKQKNFTCARRSKK
ncbi:flavodoxin family protein [Candidatus Pacearchaeota archaeon]|nr:flavodoxin family protein [Candidatus Pacearchaeota archaeon]